MKIEIIDSKLFINSVDEIIQRENSFIVVLKNGQPIVFRKPFQKYFGNKFGFRIIEEKLVDDVKIENVRKKSIEKNPRISEKKKRNFSEKQLEHQQKFAKKMKDFWNENRTDT